MKKYYVNKVAQSNGDHEVHHQDCSFLPALQNRGYLGEFVSCSGAVTAAKKTYPSANGCYFCSNSCHTS
ncbi:hypothetical protein ACFOWA_01870 [Pedobacter lithocola]|uniref:Uncharacterized protein n=1 Tax=Pedobacter lithocola TaxID=1908239 RepID=A0ABV8P6P6_9SPHI